MLDAILSAVRDFGSKIKASPPSLDGLLGLKGVIEITEAEENEAERRSAEIAVIAGFTAALASLAEMRRMLYELAALLSAYETTAFFIGEYGSADAGEFPEFAIADGIIELARNKTSTRDERYLRVLKLRGVGFREGYHDYRIETGGLRVFPRLIAAEHHTAFRREPPKQR